MPREGVSYEEVAAVADTLVAEGLRPSSRLVRERLRGTGSYNTIHRHLAKWRAAQPAARAAAPELPASVLRSIQEEITRAAATARAEGEDSLAQLQVEAADLTATGEALEAERDALTDKVSALTRERDTIAGKAAEQTAEIERLGNELERERRAAEEARIEVAQGRLSVERQAQQIDEQRNGILELRAELATERAERIEAQRQQASLEAACSALTIRLDETQKREQGARTRVSGAAGSPRYSARGCAGYGRPIGAIRKRTESIAGESCTRKR